MMKEELLRAFEASTNDLTDHMAAYSDRDFGTAPGHGKWSAAQVAAHLLMVDKVAVTVLSGFCSPTARDPFSKKQLIADHMNDLDKQFKAPAFIVPPEDGQVREALISGIIKERAMIHNIIMVADITETCMESKHPGFGQLTRAEWMYFLISHTNRHIKQLERIAAAIAG